MRKKEYGNVATFMIVGVLLMTLLAGGVLAVKSLSNRNVKTDEKRVVDNKKEEKNKEEDKDKSVDDQLIKEMASNQSDDEKRARQQQEAQGNSSIGHGVAGSTGETATDMTTDGVNATSAAGASNTTNVANVSSNEADQQSLPETGPEDSLLIVGAALLVYAGMSYVRSRRLV